jgi:hypothetical protein
VPTADDRTREATIEAARMVAMTAREATIGTL